MERIDPEGTLEGEPPSRTPCARATLGPRDTAEKERMILRLFSSYPGAGDAPLRLEAYLQALEGIPWLWVSHGLQRLNSEKPEGKPRVFCPSMPEVLAAIAAVIRDARTRANGGVPVGYTGVSGNVLNVEAELGYVRRAAARLGEGR